MTQPTPSQPQIQVVGAVLCDDLAAPTRFLAARRSYPPELAGLWEFPGGKVDPGETREAALLRELTEELDIEGTLGAQILGPEAEGAWRTSPRHLMSVWWAVTSGSSRSAQSARELRPLGSHDALAWVGRDDAFDLPWLPGDLPVVKEVVANLK